MSADALPDCKFRRWCLVSVLVIVAICISCAPKPVLREPALVCIPAGEQPQFVDDADYEQLARSIEMSLVYLRKRPPQKEVRFGADTYTVAHLIRSLERFADLIEDRPSPELLNRRIREHFLVYRAAGQGDTHQVLFTGYYEPILHGSLTRSDRFPVAVHSRPADLVEIDLSAFARDLKGRRIVGQYTGRTVIPYPDRQQIRQDAAFDQKATPIAWLRDDVDLFNLMVQGSGKIVLDDGEMFDVHFDASNGRAYRSIGRLLIVQDKISKDKMSMQAIRDYLKANPDEADAVMDHNPRYIFFHRIEQGPLGALGVSLTPNRSLAVDRQRFPMAALAFIALPTPRVDDEGRLDGWQSYHGFVLAQDTGSAITGAGRADLFWGHGARAETAAGHLKHDGRLYFLVLKPTEAGL